VAAANALLHISVEHALLLKIMRHGILRQKRSLQPDFGADPFAFAMRRIGSMVAATAAELRSEISALNLIELVDLAPCSIADGARHVDFELEN
jgi:hypothetical protein